MKVITEKQQRILDFIDDFSDVTLSQEFVPYIFVDEIVDAIQNKFAIIEKIWYAMHGVSLLHV